MYLKIRHILLVLLAVLAIAFMQPLVSFLGGLTLLFGAGVLIFRDLPPTSQDAVERRVLGWLRRARVGPAQEIALPAPPHRPPSAALAEQRGASNERPRRVRAKGAAPAVTGLMTDVPQGPDRGSGTIIGSDHPPTVF